MTDDLQFWYFSLCACVSVFTVFVSGMRLRTNIAFGKIMRRACIYFNKVEILSTFVIFSP